MINPLVVLLLIVLIITSLSIFVFEDLLYVIIIFSAFSITMSLLWQQFNSPDLAITEGAVGIGMSILMISVITRIGRRPY